MASACCTSISRLQQHCGHQGGAVCYHFLTSSLEICVATLCNIAALQQLSPAFIQQLLPSLLGPMALPGRLKAIVCLIGQA